MATPTEQYLAAEVALKQAIIEARGAIKDMHREVKMEKEKFDKLISEEVERQISSAIAGIQRDARQRLNLVIDVIRDDLRAKLDL